jgi:ABC-type transport system involved in cytochrome bd biosynthesis fused ATPase/permease subunit
MMLDIQYKGHSVDVSNLSGGERDRVILAFTMTIADMGMTPVLLLDECVSSLDQENANNVFECIKTQCKDKLVILVAHQIVTGMFDQIITL